MASYFQLQFNYGVGGYAHIETEETLNVHFHTGQRLATTFPQTVVNLRSRPTAPDCIGVGSLDLVSERLRDCLLAQQVNIELLEVEVLQRNRRTEQRYYEMNVLDVIACLDYRRSKFEESTLDSGEKWIVRIHELYIEESKLHGSRLFVMDERPIRLVREDLVNVLRSEKFTGLDFKPLPDGPF